MQANVSEEMDVKSESVRYVRNIFIVLIPIVFIFGGILVADIMGTNRQDKSPSLSTFSQHVDADSGKLMFQRRLLSVDFSSDEDSYEVLGQTQNDLSTNPQPNLDSESFTSQFWRFFQSMHAGSCSKCDSSLYANVESSQSPRLVNTREDDSFSTSSPNDRRSLLQSFVSVEDLDTWVFGLFDNRSQTCNDTFLWIALKITIEIVFLALFGTFFSSSFFLLYYLLWL